jgi:transposase
VIGEDPLCGHVFVFLNRRGDRVKLLLWDRNGWLLVYKRLERGVFRRPREAGAGAGHVLLEGPEALQSYLSQNLPNYVTITREQ